MITPITHEMVFMCDGGSMKSLYSPSCLFGTHDPSTLFPSSPFSEVIDLQSSRSTFAGLLFPKAQTQLLFDHSLASVISLWSFIYD